MRERILVALLVLLLDEKQTLSSLFPFLAAREDQRRSFLKDGHAFFLFFLYMFFFMRKSAVPRPLNPNWKKEEEEEEEVLFLSLSLYLRLKKRSLSLWTYIYLSRACLCLRVRVCVSVCIRGDVPNMDVVYLLSFPQPPQTNKQKVIETPNTAF